MRLFSLLLPCWIAGMALAVAHGQESESVPHAGEPTQSVAAVPAVAYETATLPKDHAEAWQMLKQANGLHRDSLQPWYLQAHYKAYDADGKLKAEGEYQYVWLGKNRWHATYTEGASVWTRWRSDAGVSSPPGQPATLPYPQSMISTLVRNPMEALDAPREAPTMFGEVNFGKVKLDCFSTPPPYPVSVVHGRWCVAPGRPILQLADPGYFAFFT